MRDVEASRSVCHLQHEIEHRRHVVHAEFMEAKVPKLFGIDTQMFMSHAVGVSPRVAEPNVITQVR